MSGTRKRKGGVGCSIDVLRYIRAPGYGFLQLSYGAILPYLLGRVRSGQVRSSDSVRSLTVHCSPLTVDVSACW